MSAETVNIVVVGAQYAGAAFLKAFLKGMPRPLPTNIQITVIDPKNYFYHNMASPRAVVDADVWSKRVLIPMDAPTLFGKHFADGQTRFIQGKVTTVEANQVQVTQVNTSSNGDGNGDQVPLTVPFHYLVLATGTGYHSPAKLDATRSLARSRSPSESV